VKPDPLKRQQALEAGERLSLVPAELTVRPWTVLADTSAQTLYTYFGGIGNARQAVTVHMTAAVLEWVEARLVAVEAAPDDDPEDQLIDTLCEWVRFVAERPGPFAMLLRGRGPGADECPVGSAAEAVIRLVADQIKAAGLDPSAGYEATARVLLGVAGGHGLAVAAGWSEAVEVRDRGIFTRVLGLRR
jgi:AcrR family transcriptional regulator